jgi:muconate cycloisomerase
MPEKLKITRIETIPVSIPYRIPWRNKHTELAGKAITHLEATVLKVHTDGGIVGLGEARGANVPEEMAGRWGALLKGRDPLQIEGLLNELEAAFGLGRMLAGIDFALHDITGKALGLPVYQLLGGKARERVPLVWTLPYVDPDLQAKQARERVAEGFRHAVKMKVGVAGDQAHVDAVARAIPDVPLRPDNNQGHDFETALRQFRALKEAGVKIELIEDPSPSDWDAYQRLSEALDLPVSVHAGWRTLQDLGELIRANKPGIRCVNVTFAAWGIRRTLQIAGALECAGIGWSMGTSHEAGIKTAAALHAGCAARNHLYPADVLGALLLEGDVVKGLDMKGGYGRPSDGPGLGVELDEDAIERFRA